MFKNYLLLLLLKCYSKKTINIVLKQDLLFQSYNTSKKLEKLIQASP